MSSDTMDKTVGWLGFGMDCGLLMAEAAMVAPLRLMRLAGGGTAACEEADLMVSEKIDAQIKLAGALAAGQFGHQPDRVARGVARHYLGYVQANRRRLLRVPPR